MIDSNKQIVREYLEAGNRGEIAALLALLDRERFRLCCHAAAPIGYVLDYGELERMLVRMAEATGGTFTITIDQMTAEDDRVAVQAHSQSTTAVGGTYANEYHFLFTLRNGAIIRLDEYLCSLTLVRNLDPAVWEEAKRLPEGS